MCQRENYMFSLYLLMGSISLFTSGIFTVMSMGRVHRRKQFEERQEITEMNQLPTSTSVKMVPRIQPYSRVVF